MKLAFNLKTAILSMICVMIIGGAFGYFMVHPFAYNINTKDVAQEVSDGLTKIKQDKGTIDPSKVKVKNTLNKLAETSK